MIKPGALLRRLSAASGAVRGRPLINLAAAQRKATTTADSGGNSTRSRCRTTPGSVASSTVLGTARKLTVCGIGARFAATAHWPRFITT